jgi:predicted nuclease of predicted toxin-antitoxin system
MKLKLDENVDLRLVPILEAKGHDVDTVLDEGLSGSDDDVIYGTCRTVGRVLITLDTDFSNPFRFPPSKTEGIIVVRPPRAVLSAIKATLLGAFAQSHSALYRCTSHELTYMRTL